MGDIMDPNWEPGELDLDTMLKHIEAEEFCVLPHARAIARGLVAEIRVLREELFPFRLEGPQCRACGLPVAQHPDPNPSFAVCADALNYRLKRAAAYWESRAVDNLKRLFDEAEAAP